MWRSIFYAVGIGLFGLGIQGLVLDHVMIPKDTKLQKLFRKIVADDGPRRQNPGFTVPQSVASGTSHPFPKGNQYPDSPQAQQSASSRFADFNSNSGASRYGPSRFAGPAYGTGYGGGRVGSSAPSRPSFGSGIPTQPRNAQLAGYERNTVNQTLSGQRSVGGLQKLVVREWMPWSLLASGAIIFLYTRTMDPRRHHD